MAVASRFGLGLAICLILRLPFVFSAPSIDSINKGGFIGKSALNCSLLLLMLVKTTRVRLLCVSLQDWLKGCYMMTRIPVDVSGRRRRLPIDLLHLALYFFTYPVASS